MIAKRLGRGGESSMHQLGQLDRLSIGPCSPQTFHRINVMLNGMEMMIPMDTA